MGNLVPNTQNISLAQAILFLTLPLHFIRALPCTKVSESVTLSELHSIFASSDGNVLFCPEFSVSSENCDTNGTPFALYDRDLKIGCDNFFGTNGLHCEINCPGRHFDVGHNATLYLDGMMLKGATEGSVDVMEGGNLIAFDSTWEGNERRGLQSPSSSSSLESAKWVKSVKSAKAAKWTKSPKSAKSTKSEGRTELNQSDINDRGGAVYGYEQSYVTLTNNKFLYNIAEGDGGALYIDGSVQINNCELKNNLSLEGSGGALFASDTAVATIRNTAFEDNSAKLQGPGMYFKHGATTNMVDNSGCGNTSLNRNSKLESSSWSNNCLD